MLTDRTVRSAAPGVHPDGDNLYLRVRDGGTRTWVYRDRIGGKDKWVTLGRYPKVSLAAARGLAERRKSGLVDKSVADGFKDYYLTVTRDYRRPEQVKWMIENLVLAHIGEEVIATMPRARLMKIFQDIATKGTNGKPAPVMANRTFSAVRRMFVYFEHQGWIEHNPLAGVRSKFVGGKEHAKKRHLDWHEIEEFLRTLPGMTTGVALGLYAILATGLRPSEALFFLKQRQAHDIPTKTTLHRVPLTPHLRMLLALDIDPLPHDAKVLSQALRRLGKTYTPHDLRRTFSSRLSDLGVAPHVVEKLLNHKMLGSMAVYNRSEYWPERIAAMRLWHRKLRELKRNVKKRPT